MSTGEGDDRTTAFAVRRNEDGDLMVAISFNGQRFEGGRLPVSAIPSLATLQDLLNSVARDVDLELNDHTRKSRLANVELVLTGEIDEGSARLTALVLPVVLAAPAARTSQAILIEEAVRRVPVVTTELASRQPLSYPTSPKTVGLVRDLSRQVKPGERVVLDVASPREDASAASFNGIAEFSPDLGALLDDDLSVNTMTSFFVTGTLRRLEDRGDEGHMSLVTRSGQFQVPATPDDRQLAARLYGEARTVIFAVSGRGVADGAGRLISVSHMSRMTTVDRMFDMTTRLEELRGLAEDPDDAILAARIGRATSSIPTIVHETGLAPALFLTDENEIEARWIVGSRVVNVTFGSDIEVYVFDRSTEEMVLDEVIDEDDEVLPGWPIADAINRVRGDL